MLEKIKLLLNLWDPYKIYLFPDDEYIDFAIKIDKFLANNKNLSEETLIEFIYKVIPPIDSSNDDRNTNEILFKIEYARFAKVILSLILHS